MTNSTNYQDAAGTASSSYTVRAVKNGVEQARFGERQALGAKLPAHPAPGSRRRHHAGSPQCETANEAYTYSANDGSVGDVDGDGAIRNHPQVGPVQRQRQLAIRLHRQCLPRRLQARRHAALAHRSRHEHPRGRPLHAVHRLRLRRRRQGRDGRQDGARHPRTATDASCSSGRRPATTTTLTTLGEQRDGAHRLRADRPRVSHGVQRPERRRAGDGRLRRAARHRELRGATTTAIASTASSRPRRTSTTPATPSFVMARGYYTRTTLDGLEFPRRAAHSTVEVRQQRDAARTPPVKPYTGQGAHSLSVANVDADLGQEIIYGAMIDRSRRQGQMLDRLRPRRRAARERLRSVATRARSVHAQRRRRSPGVPRDRSQHLRSHRRRSDRRRSRHRPRRRRRHPRRTTRAPRCGPPARTGTSRRGDRQECRRPRPSSINFLIWWDADESRELEDGTAVTKYGGGTLHELHRVQRRTTAPNRRPR